MGVDVNSEVMKAAEIMTRYRMPREDQLEVVRILLSSGVEHCLSEQERVRAEKEAYISQAQGQVH